METTLDETLANLALLQRDDGLLADGIVGINTLSTDALAVLGGLIIRGAWLPGTAYVAGDVVSNAGAGGVLVVEGDDLVELVVPLEGAFHALGVAHGVLELAVRRQVFVVVNADDDGVALVVELDLDLLLGGLVQGYSLEAPGFFSRVKREGGKQADEQEQGGAAWDGPRGVVGRILQQDEGVVRGG